MKNRIIYLFIAIVSVFLYSSCNTKPEVSSQISKPPVTIDKIPEFTNYVVDDANLLSGQEENKLNDMLKAYQDSTSNQLAVLIIEYYDDRTEGPLFDFSKAVFDKWKIGQKSKNNGVLLVVVKKLETKNAPGLRIVTGYGAEGPLPDATCKQIIENDIRPSVNEGKYYEGIDVGLTKMIDHLKGEFSVDESFEIAGWMIVVIIMIILVLFVIFLIIIGGGSSGGGSYSSSDSGSSYSGDSGGGGFDGGGGGGSGGGGAGD